MSAVVGQRVAELSLAFLRTQNSVIPKTTSVLGSCDRASWANYEERKANMMQQLDVYYCFLMFFYPCNI